MTTHPVSAALSEALTRSTFDDTLVPMSTRMSRSVVRRPNLPLNAEDDRELERLKTSSQYRAAIAELADSRPSADAELSEGVLLHAVFEVGMAAIRERAQEIGYSELAADADYVAAKRERRAATRTPRWADES